MGLTGIIKGLGITIKHFIDTYLVDIKFKGKRYGTEEGLLDRSSYDTKGIFTVQYPEEKMKVPEAFRYIPFLVYDETETGEKDIRCTACGICSKVCPPQCIWITRSTNPETGKPVAKPAKFFIDVDICMNCGLCAEYCPFEAIRMDHDYEIANVDRSKHHIFDLEKLLKPASYYAKIRPTQFKEEDDARKEKEAKKAAARAAKEA
jgi:NADH-quinone oxidoreductase subunit I